MSFSGQRFEAALSRAQLRRFFSRGEPVEFVLCEDEMKDIFPRGSIRRKCPFQDKVYLNHVQIFLVDFRLKRPWVRIIYFNCMHNVFV